MNRDELKPLAWAGAGAGLLGAAAAFRRGALSFERRRGAERGYELIPGDPDFRRAAESLTGIAVTDGNRLELLVNGDQIFPAMIETIESARHTLNVETYVYWQGDIANQMAEAICDRARDGVECRVILDAFGSLKMEPDLFEKMEQAGVEVVKFRPARFSRTGPVNNRTHRRVLVADGKVGMTGGVGIAEEWTGNAGSPDCWRDSHVRIEGPAVHYLQGAFAEHWVEETGEVLVGRDPGPEPEPIQDGSSVQVVRSSAGVGDTSIEILYYLAIGLAEESIELTAAYFAPRTPFVKALCDAAERGVSVRILVPGEQTDKELVRLAGRDVYEQLLECGVEIFEYQPTMLHAKSVTIDDSWASIGTVNFDNRSFSLNDEITLCAYGGDLVTSLRQQFERDLEEAEPIDPGRWSNRPLLSRLAERATRPLRPQL